MIFGIITDIHNNAAALRAVLDRLDQMRCDMIICCGDIIGIGPDPEGTVQEMMRIPSLISVRGNHEKYLLEGMPAEYPNEENMSFGEMEHHHWEHRLLSAESVAFLQSLPYRTDFECEGITVSVMHSCMDKEGHFRGSVRNPDSSDLSAMFADVNSDVILYGHDHDRNICRGTKLYINACSLGCPSRDRNIARAGVLKIEKGSVTVEPVDVPYDADSVVRQIEALRYPDAENILRYFYGR